MKDIAARDILNMSRHDVWGLNEPEYCVVYEDGVREVNSSRYIIFSRYCWELLRLFPNTPVVSLCGVKTTLGTGTYDADTHTRTLERLFKYIVGHNNLETFAQKENLLKMVYKIIDYIQNEIVEQALPYAATISARDFTKILKVPEIANAHASMSPTPEGVDRTYKAIRGYMQNAPMKDRLGAAYRNKSVNDNQANQCIGPRGFVSRRNLTVHLHPVLNGFIRGMGNLYELIVESLTAAKSLAANEDNIKRSEYTSRRIQMLAMTVRNVVDGDCGSTNYLDIHVTNGLLDTLKGKFYLKEDGTMGCIDGSETHLDNTIVKFRTTFGCQHHEANRICSTCLGKLSQNFQNNTNLGYTMVAYLMEKITQAILSTKHLTHSVKKSMIQLFGLAATYFYPDEEGDLFFHPDTDLTGLQIVLANSKLDKLGDVLNLPADADINLNKIGELSEIIIRRTNTKSPANERITLSYKDRNCIITKAFLDHMKQVKIETDSRSNFIIPMDQFDKSQPVFNSPLKEANILNFVQQISNIIEKKPNKVSNPLEKFFKFYSLVLEKFKINVSVLEVIIYATTTYNAQAGNYRLGRGSQTPYSDEALAIFAHRDFAAFAAYERQMGPLLEDPMVTFGLQHRESHPLALYFTPQDIVTE